MVEQIDRLAPGRVLRPIAVDPGRGWLLLPDGGLTVAVQAARDPRDARDAQRDGTANVAMWMQLLRE